jgi:uncharacterized iron-regulated membrane protein
MNDILSTAIALASLVAAFTGLVVWVRRDSFATRAQHPALDTADADPTFTAPVVATTIAGRRTRVLQVTSR